MEIEPVELVHRDFGGEDRPPLVVLHGLLGSSRNWAGAARGLTDSFHVLAPDLRNHGRSPHASPHTYAAMEADLRAWSDRTGIGQTLLLGHSMGGKLAMRLACRQPDQVRALVVVDIAPGRRQPRHDDEFRAMNALPLDRLKSRAEAEAWMEKEIPSWGMRQFLLTNLDRREEGGFSWQINLPVLTRDLEATGAAPVEEGETFEGPVLFLIGGKSDFVTESHHPLIRRHFPQADIRVVENWRHNPHIENRGEFTRMVTEFTSAL